MKAKKTSISSRLVELLSIIGTIGFAVAVTAWLAGNYEVAIAGLMAFTTPFLFAFIAMVGGDHHYGIEHQSSFRSLLLTVFTLFISLGVVSGITLLRHGVEVITEAQTWEGVMIMFFSLVAAGMVVRAYRAWYYHPDRVMKRKILPR